MNQGIRILTALYAIFLIVLGILGLQQAKSYISFFLGLIFGVIVLSSSIFMMKEKKWAYFVNAICTFLLTIVFAFRFSASHSFNTIAMTLFSFFLCILLVIEIFRFYGKEV